MTKGITQWQVTNTKSRSFSVEGASHSSNKDFTNLLESILDWWRVIQDNNTDDDTHMIYSIDFTYSGEDDTETATVSYTTG